MMKSPEVYKKLIEVKASVCTLMKRHLQNTNELQID